MTTATLTESATELEVLRCIPESDLQELDAIGDGRDDGRFAAGDMARKWVDEFHLPVGVSCRIIGRHVDYGEERVRQLLYTSRFLATSPKLFLDYTLLRYSIFEHARKCSNPEDVLKAALEGQLTLGAVKMLFPPAADELKDLIGRVPQHHKEAAQQIINRCIGGLKELIE